MPSLTPLFPEENLPITIKQGNTGDCYLLAALDCIFQSKEGYDQIKSLFKEVPGGVEVRIKAARHLTDSNRENMQGKYAYYYDSVRGEHVFFLSQRRLNEIDNSKDGVDSNSLAVKILERLIPYFFLINGIIQKEEQVYLPIIQMKESSV